MLIDIKSPAAAYYYVMESRTLVNCLPGIWGRRNVDQILVDRITVADLYNIYAKQLKSMGNSNIFFPSILRNLEFEALYVNLPPELRATVNDDLYWHFINNTAIPNALVAISLINNNCIDPSSRLGRVMETTAVRGVADWFRYGAGFAQFIEGVFPSFREALNSWARGGGDQGLIEREIPSENIAVQNP